MIHLKINKTERVLWLVSLIIVAFYYEKNSNEIRKLESQINNIEANITK